MSEAAHGAGGRGKGAGDERLVALLRAWKSVEPGADFDAAVWRRIRAVPVHARPRSVLSALLPAWHVPSLGWVNALAATAGIVVGLSLAFAMPFARNADLHDMPLLQSETLAGSYLGMAGGGHR